MATCKECLHYRVCAGSGLILDPLHGGVICEDYKHKEDVVEVVHGEWKIKSDDYDCEYMMCSCCKEEFYPVDADTVDTTPNYCPNCGAKMGGDKDA